MDRRKWFLLAGLVVAVVVAVWGTLLATGQGGDSARKPEGRANVIRLQAVSGEVSCGAAPAVVYIYLDDLVPRPSLDNPAVSSGLIAFQFPIQYDPGIVRLVAPNEVQLNSQLGQQDIDGDGIIRSFLPTLSIDDEAGQAMIGAVSYVPSSRGGPGENREEGIDPVAKGEPLLLLTLRFTPVGIGKTDIKVEPWLTDLAQPDLIDPERKLYENLVFENTTLTVRGGACVASPTPPPTETPRPTVEPFEFKSPTPVPWRTVTAPDAATAGRSDCPAGWVAYTDPKDRYSICFPADFRTTASDSALNASGDAAEGQEAAFGIIVSWSAGAGYFYGPPSPETCVHYTNIVEGPISSEFVEVTLGDRQVPACFTIGPIQSSLHGSIALANDGSDREGNIYFSVNFIDSDLSRVPFLGKSILETLSVNFR